MFSATNSYRDFIRLKHSYMWSPEIEQALITVGKLVGVCMR